MRYRRPTNIALCLVLASLSSPAQRKPELGSRPDPGLGRVEVRFALGKNAVTCKEFSLTVTRNGETLIDGRFSSGFQLPSASSKLQPEETINVQIACAKQQWRFSQVPGTALSQGWWWVGTEYPPFDAEYRNPRFAKCRVIRYLKVDGTGQLGFGHLETIPSTLDGSHEACTGK
jgi:hypothetical protein